jgi:Protein of unknown function (DUF3455)
METVVLLPRISTQREEAMKRISIVLSILAAGCASSPSTVKVPDSLKAGANESLALIVAATGVQIYECRDRKWLFVAPEAELWDARGRKVGSHYAGPHWESPDGSKIVGTVKQRADAPAASAIPWLLLGAKSVGKEGAFSKVTSIQRLATAGGVAPAGGCNQPGEEARVYYSADYYFFTAK